MHTIRRRIDRLYADRVQHANVIPFRPCQGKDRKEVIAQVELSIPPESAEVVADICRHVEEMAAQTARERPDGRGGSYLATKDHGFLEWLGMLRTGASSLPEMLPPTYLLAWRNGYANHLVTPRCYRCFCEFRRDEHGCVEAGAVCPRCGKRDLCLASPQPIFRCEACKLVMPNAMPNGFGRFAVCPACGSACISQRALWLGPVDQFVPDPHTLKQTRTDNGQ